MLGKTIAGCSVLLLAALLIIAGCPQQAQPVVEDDELATGQARDYYRDSGDFNYIASDVELERPSSAPYVYVPRPDYYIGQNAQIEYKLDKPIEGEAYLALIPVNADGTPTDEQRAMEESQELRTYPEGRSDSLADAESSDENSAGMSQDSNQQANASESESAQNDLYAQPGMQRPQRPDGVTLDEHMEGSLADVGPYNYVPPQYEVDSAQDNLDVALTYPGTYVLQLYTYDPYNNRQVVTESEMITVRSWPRSNGRDANRPRLSVSSGSLNGASNQSLSFTPGQEVVADFMLPDNYPEGSWIGVAPAGRLPDGTMATDVQVQQQMELQQLRNGEVNWTAQAPGEYVFRLYPIPGSTAYFTAESQPFTVGSADNTAASADMDGEGSSSAQGTIDPLEPEGAINDVDGDSGGSDAGTSSGDGARTAAVSKSD